MKYSDLQKAQEIVTNAISKPETAVPALSSLLKLCAESHNAYTAKETELEGLKVQVETTQQTMEALRQQNTNLLLNRQPSDTTGSSTQTQTKEKEEPEQPTVEDVAKALAGGLNNATNESNN